MWEGVKVDFVFVKYREIETEIEGYSCLTQIHPETHTHSRLTALCPGLPGWAGTRKVKPIWILLK